MDQKDATVGLTLRLNKLGPNRKSIRMIASRPQKPYHPWQKDD